MSTNILSWTLAGYREAQNRTDTMRQTRVNRSENAPSRVSVLAQSAAQDESDQSHMEAAHDAYKAARRAARLTAQAELMISLIDDEMGA